MSTNPYVVTNLDKVVELHTVFYHGILQCSPVNAGVGTNLNIVAYPYVA